MLISDNTEWYMVFFLLQDEIVTRIDVNLSVLPKSIFERFLTNVYSFSDCLLPWETGFLAIEADKYLLFG